MTQQSSAAAAARVAPAPEPPRHVLEAWLKHFLQQGYEQTGEWPMPPSFPDDTEPSEVSGQAASPDSVARSASEEAARRWGANADPQAFVQLFFQGLEERGLRLVSTTTAFEQQEREREQREKKGTAVPKGKRLQMVVSRTREEHEAKFTDSEGPYHPYFLEATRLLEEKESGIADKSLMADCRRVLAFLIALMYFPLFRGQGGRQGEWVTIGLNRMRDELGINAQRLWSGKEDGRQNCLTALKNAGLIQVMAVEPASGIIPPQAGFMADSDYQQLKDECSYLGEKLGGGRVGYWTRRSVQHNQAFYRLGNGIRLSEGLPVFNPFDQESGINQGWQSILDSNESGIASKRIRHESANNQADFGGDMANGAKIRHESANNQSSTLESGMNQPDSAPINNINLKNINNYRGSRAETADQGKGNQALSESYPPGSRVKSVKELEPDQRTAFSLLYNCGNLVGQKKSFDYKAALDYCQKYSLETIRVAIRQAHADFTHRKETNPQAALKDSFTGFIVHHLKHGGDFIPPSPEEQEELAQIAREEFSKLVSVERSQSHYVSRRKPVAGNGTLAPATAALAQVLNSSSINDDDDDEHYVLPGTNVRR